MRTQFFEIGISVTKDLRLICSHDIGLKKWTNI